VIEIFSNDSPAFGGYMLKDQVFSSRDVTRIPQKSEENWSKKEESASPYTIPGKISFSVTLDQIQRVLLLSFFKKLS
jgi:hypothetical protein